MHPDRIIPDAYETLHSNQKIRLFVYLHGCMKRNRDEIFEVLQYKNLGKRFISEIIKKSICARADNGSNFFGR